MRQHQHHFFRLRKNSLRSIQSFCAAFRSDHLSHCKRSFSIHKTLIDRFGGSYGIRDVGGLESALARPQTGYYRDLIEEGAALWESLSQNHPFIDDNKRVRPSR